MPLNWIDVTNLSFNTLLLLERVQLSWLPGWVPEPEMAIALSANPAVEWYLRHKCPEIASWLDQLEKTHQPSATPTPGLTRQAEVKILQTINDLVVYAVDPSIYDAQPFLGWDPRELLDLADFGGKVVLDVGSGTGKLAFIAAELAQAVFAVEPVGNLRHYLQHKARSKRLKNFFTVDGLITAIPFPDGFADITMAGHVYGDYPEPEVAEMCRVTKKGGSVIFCPGSSQNETPGHEYLISQGFSWSEFEEPTEGMKRKYWKTIE